MTISDDKKITDIDVLRANINNETSQINWSELQRFFAGGWLIYVNSNTNLLDVAVASAILTCSMLQWLSHLMIKMK
jgi:hypothetical protein